MLLPLQRVVARLRTLADEYEEKDVFEKNQKNKKTKKKEEDEKKIYNH